MERLGDLVKVWGDYELRSIDQPEVQLSETEQGFLATELQSVATNGFGRVVIAESIRSHAFSNQDRLLLVTLGTEIVGFASLQNYAELQITFLTGVVFSRKHQGKGLGCRITRELSQSSPFSTFALTTQNPHVYAIVTQICHMVYPSIEEVTIPNAVKRAGVRIMKGREGVFDVDTFAIKDYYDKCCYPALPWSSNPVINGMFRTKLRVNADNKTRDGFLVMGTNLQ